MATIQVNELTDAQRAARVNLLNAASGGLTTSFNQKLRNAKRIADETADVTTLSSLTLDNLREDYNKLKDAKDKLEACFLEAASLVDDKDRGAFED